MSPHPTPRIALPALSPHPSRSPAFAVLIVIAPLVSDAPDPVPARGTARMPPSADRLLLPLPPDATPYARRSRSPLVPELAGASNTSTPLTPFAPAFAVADRDRAARRGDALTTAHTHSAAREYRALSGCHRQQTACTTVAAAYRDADHARLARCRRTRADRDRAARARARRAGAEHQTPLTPFAPAFAVRS